MTKILIKNGTVIDGTGDSPFKGSVLIDGDKIKVVIKEGEPLPPADEIIDADGLCVSPGFIDMHSHNDWLMPLDNHENLLKYSLEQGVTTIIGGNCGVSPAPVRKENVSDLVSFASIMMEDEFNFTWNSMAEYMDVIDEAGPAVNIAELTGHTSIRYAAADTRRGQMTPDEMEACKDALRKSFEEGSSGLSFGLGYDPGMYSPLTELEGLCKVAADHDKPVTVHLKALSRISPCYPVTSFGSHNVRALREMLQIAEKTKVKLQLSHFIFVGRTAWPTVDKCLQIVENARKNGVDVMIDAFPYTCGNTTINAPFPYWFLEIPPNKYKNKWARRRLKIELEIGFRLAGFIYKDFQVMDVAIKGYEELNGMTIAQIAEKWGISPFNTMLKLSEESHGATLMLFHAYSGGPENLGPIKKVLTNELCLFETDAVVKSTGYPNPAALGTFPKILADYVRKEKLISIEDAVSRMTAQSAERFGIKDRGHIKIGQAADIVLFNPDLICDVPPNGKTPAKRPQGIDQVYLNGVLVVKDGEYTGKKSGQVIRV